jgi:hypothetical protein
MRRAVIDANKTAAGNVSFSRSERAENDQKLDIAYLA